MVDPLTLIYENYILEGAAEKVTLDLSAYEKCMWKAVRDLLPRMDPPAKEEEFRDDINSLVEESRQNLQKLIDLLVSALDAVGYNGAPLTVSYHPSLDTMINSYELSPATGNWAYVNVGNGRNGFALSIDPETGKIDIDDILEAGDEDMSEFFTTPQDQQDYFTAIQALQNYGKKHRIITLYTARPRSERDFYENTDTLPANIFLTNSQSHAEGLARDLSVGDEIRDVYRVRISTENLLNTLPGSIQYFQLVRPTKVVSIKRVQ